MSEEVKRPCLWRCRRPPRRAAWWWQVSWWYVSFLWFWAPLPAKVKKTPFGHRRLEPVWQDPSLPSILQQSDEKGNTKSSAPEEHTGKKQLDRNIAECYIFKWKKTLNFLFLRNTKNNIVFFGWWIQKMIGFERNWLNPDDASESMVTCTVGASTACAVWISQVTVRRRSILL